MPAALTGRRFTVGEYYRVAEAGILGADERVELIEGEIVTMAAIGSRHSATVMRLTRVFSRELGDRTLVLVHAACAGLGATTRCTSPPFPSSRSPLPRSCRDWRSRSPERDRPALV